MRIVNKILFCLLRPLHQGAMSGPELVLPGTCQGIAMDRVDRVESRFPNGRWQPTIDSPSSFLVFQAVLGYNGAVKREQTQAKILSLLAIPLAAGGWWGLYQLTDNVGPDQPGALALFFALLFLTLTATLAPVTAFLNRRFAPRASSRAPWRYLRHSVWGAMCLSSWAWLQMHRAFNLGFAFIIGLIFVAVEVFIVRMRSEAP